ncbi:MAG TPA: hypothetical protein P5069_13385, partial [Candidatus Hydrogenedentes bacterium]|nr:hypothetical protein [Candidatus Hydrogenedentota bacterium]
MNRRAAYKALVIGLAVAVGLTAGPAAAASPLENLGKAAASAARSGALKAPGRSLRGIGTSRGLSSPGGRSLRGIPSVRGKDPFSGSTAGRALRDGLSSGRNGLRAPGSLSGRGSSGRDLGKGLDRDRVMDALGGLMNRGGYGDYGGHGGYGGWNDYENEMADAYRDVGIANAVVGLVGIAAQVAVQSRQYAAPAQQYRTERVLVAPARYETTQVWIPESYDPRTGVKLGGGFYETRTQYVPEVYEDHLVPVASAAPVYAPAPAVVAAPAPAAIPYAAHHAGALLPPPPPARAQL